MHETILVSELYIYIERIYYLFDHKNSNPRPN